MTSRAPKLWLMVFIIGILTLMPIKALAGITPEEVRVFENRKSYIFTQRKDLSSGRTTLESYRIMLFGLGWHYYVGSGVVKNENEAIKCWREAAEYGYGIAQFNIGNCYHEGIGVIRDDIEAYAYWSMAAINDELFKKIPLDFLDSADSRIIFEKIMSPVLGPFKYSADSARNARINLAILNKEMTALRQLQGQNRMKELQAAIEVRLKPFDDFMKVAAQAAQVKFDENMASALEGKAISQFYVAEAYFIGNGVAQDDVTAFNWYKKAAEGGHASAQYKLGLAYFGWSIPLGFDPNPTEAVKWLRKAAEKGHKASQNEMADCFAAGLGVPKNVIEAYAYYNISRLIGDHDYVSERFEAFAKGLTPEERNLGKQRTKELRQEIDGRMNGDAGRELILGLAYARGEDAVDSYGLSSWFRVGPKDPAEAVWWYRKSAEQGNASAQYFLGNALMDGSGIIKDLAEGLKWHHKASDQGHAASHYALGHAYELGVGVPKDEIEAYAFFNLAGATDADARKRLESLEQNMLPNVRLLGQQRTKELLKEIEGRTDSLEVLKRAAEKDSKQRGT